MCKLFIMTNTTKLKHSQSELLVKTVSKSMSKTERDGFGLSIRGSGGIFTRRFLKPEAASIFETFSKMPFLKPSMNETGTLGTIESIILHGRTSTNHGGLVNTHPISKHGFHLSHNGVVEDSGPAYPMTTQNDTEHVVERFSKGINEVEKHLSGYYAFGAFQDGTESLFIVRDSIAPLYFADVPSIECHVFSTTKELIVSTMEALRLTHSPIEELQDNTMLVYQGKDLVSQSTISPKGRSKLADSLADKSLGHSLSNPAQWASNYVLDAEDMFLDEVESLADHTWTFFRGKSSITISEFLELQDTEKLKCVVIRSDGTLCSPDPDRDGKFFEGTL